MRHLLISAAAIATIHAVALAETAPPKNADADKIVCRKTLETGSLVKKNKQCFTLAEWDKIYAANREGNEKTRAQLSGGYNCTGDGC